MAENRTSAPFGNRLKGWFEPEASASAVVSGIRSRTPAAGARRYASPRPSHTIPWCCTEADTLTAVQFHSL